MLHTTAVSPHVTYYCCLKLLPDKTCFGNAVVLAVSVHNAQIYTAVCLRNYGPHRVVTQLAACSRGCVRDGSYLIHMNVLLNLFVRPRLLHSK